MHRCFTFDKRYSIWISFFSYTAKTSAHLFCVTFSISVYLYVFLCQDKTRERERVRNRMRNTHKRFMCTRTIIKSGVFSSSSDSSHSLVVMALLLVLLLLLGVCVCVCLFLVSVVNFGMMLWI